MSQQKMTEMSQRCILGQVGSRSLVKAVALNTSETLRSSATGPGRIQSVSDLRLPLHCWRVHKNALSVVEVVLSPKHLGRERCSQEKYKKANRRLCAGYKSAIT